MTAPTPAQTQREHDADDLVTEELCEQFWGAYVGSGSYRAALRAVAPMIAARGLELAQIDMGALFPEAVAAEREANAKIAETYPYDVEGSDLIAAAIRARGETGHAER
jgi:hypothetical protein